ncbi:MAG TPA: hypothetical protein VF105_02825 [Gemmatimonadaceae bacterium]
MEERLVEVSYSLHAVKDRLRSVARSGSTYVTLGLSPLSQRANIPQLEQPIWLKLVLRGALKILLGSRYTR